jgi:hypothetical protein
MPDLIAHAARGRSALEARLETRPPWGSSFLIALAAQAPEPAIALAYLSDLGATPAKPTAAEWTAYFARRVKDQAYGVAYLDWLRTLPPSALAQAKAIYDGGFAGLPGVPPFNWRLGGEAEIDRPKSEAAGVLHARYDGYGAPELAEQLLLLAPGSYRFSGRARAAGDASGALAWILLCADAPGVILAQVPAPGAAGEWRAFSAAVQVPGAGCAAQWLRLTPLPVDHVRPVEVWYGALAMDRVG